VRDLSLHILDLIENSIRADASVVSVTIVESPAENTLQIVVEDNGSGLTVAPDKATDPFYTTKGGKRTGLGLSLFRAAAEQAGGSITIYHSELGGIAVEAVMQLDHVDRSPLGNLATTLSSVACTNPELNLSCRLRVGDREQVIRFSDVAKEQCISGCCGLVVAREILAKVNAALESMGVGS